MQSSILDLEIKIKQSEERNSDLVDSYIHLADLVRDHDTTKSISLCNIAIEISTEIGYDLGIAKSYLSLGQTHSKNREFDAAIKYYHLTLPIYESKRDKEGRSIVQHKLGNAYYFLGKYPEALEHYNKSVDLKIMLGDDIGAANLYTNLGAVYNLANQPAEGIKSLLKALKLFESHNDFYKVTVCYINIGEVYYSQYDISEAYNYYRKAIDLSAKHNFENRNIELWINYGLVLMKMGKYEEAKEIQERALKETRATNNQYKIAICLSNLGDLNKALNNYENAMDYYLDSVDIFEELKDFRGITLSAFNLGELYYLLNRYSDAKIWLEKSLKFSLETGFKDLQRKSYELLGKILTLNHEFETASRYYENVINLDKELSKLESSKLISQLTFKNEIEQKEKEAKIIQAKNNELILAYDSIEIEKKRSDELLLNILPEEVANELKEKGKATAKLYDNTTILFTDFIGFTNVSMILSPQELIEELHTCFKAFDEIISKYNIEKIKTIGDAYIAVSGLPRPNSNHALDIVLAAQEILEFIKSRKLKLKNRTFSIRIGVNSGSVIAGIVGVKKFVYDIWGDAVNIAARMEQNCETNQINISDSTYELIKDKLKTEYRGELETKNRGKLKMYFVH